MHLLDVGPHAVLAEVAGTGEALDLARWASAGGLDDPGPLEVLEVVPAATTVLFDGVADPGELRRRLGRWRPTEGIRPGREVELPTTYDGADLDHVARAWGTDRHGVASRHQELDLVVAFCGFAPGFAYLSGLPAELAVPRLASPRTRVPPGSVALADAWCGVYPSASPGGWRILGTVDLAEVVLWDADREQPALLVPGTRVRFTSR